MWRRVAVRIALLPLIFLAVSATSYFLLYGPLADEPEPDISCGLRCDEEALDALREQFGLNDPWYEGYAAWLADAVRGDLGETEVSQRSIASDIRESAPPTIELIFIAALTSTIAGAALASLMRRFAPSDEPTLAALALVSAVPATLALVLLVVVPARHWNYVAPIGGYVPIYEDVGRNLRLLVPPGLTLGLGLGGLAALVFLRTDGRRHRAWAVAAWLSVGLPILVTSAVVTELLYSVNGLGIWLFSAGFRADRPSVQALASLLVTGMIALTAFVRLRPRTTAKRGTQIPAHATNVLLVVGSMLVGVFVLVAVVGSTLTGDWRALNRDEAFQEPSLSHLFGTNSYGQDLVAQIVVASRDSLLVVAPLVGVVFVPVFLATAFGASRWPAARRWAESISVYALSVPAFAAVSLVLAMNPGATESAVRAAATIASVGFAVQSGARVDTQAGMRGVKEAWPLALEAVCWVVAATLLLKASVDFLYRPANGDATFGGLIAVGSLTAGESWNELLAPGITLTLIVFGFLLIAFRLAAWRWEAEANALEASD